MHDFFFLKANKKFIKIRFAEILYIEVIKKYTFLITSEKRYLVQTSLNHVEEVLPQAVFCRINKFNIVHLSHINYFDNQSVCVGKKLFPLGRLYKKKLMTNLIILDNSK